MAVVAGLIALSGCHVEEVGEVEGLGFELLELFLSDQAGGFELESGAD